MIEKEQKNEILRLSLAIIILFGAMLSESLHDFSRLMTVALYLAAYIIAGGDVLLEAGKGLLHGEVFDENFLMGIATIGAIALGEFKEACVVMILFGIGELFEDIAESRTERSIESLVEILPDYAVVLRDGKEVKTDPEDVEIGEIIVVRAGEKIPLDGIIVDGTTSADTAALTGESLPRDLETGDEAVSGTVNLTGVIKIEVTRVFSESSVSKIIELTKNATSRKTSAEKFITRFAKVYTPIVCALALLAAVIPPLALSQSFSVWLYRALTFLVIACPCALVISVPLAFFCGIGKASRNGVLIKGSRFLEVLAEAGTVVFDKTGTLTTGHFAVSEIVPSGKFTEETLLELAAYAESYSHHPLAQAIMKRFGREIDFDRIIDAREQAGRGVETSVTADNREFTIHAGNDKLMWDIGIYDIPEVGSTAIFVAVDGNFAGYMTFEDEVKSDAAEAVEKLRGCGIEKMVVLTGDTASASEKLTSSLNVDEVFSELLPEDKVYHIERIIREEEFPVIYVGDGINDAPVLARSDAGVAMGAFGSDAAIEAADIVIASDEPSRLVLAVETAKRAVKTAKVNIIFALAVKIVVMALAAVGWASMWLAIFADVGVCILAVLNSARVLR